MTHKKISTFSCRSNLRAIAISESDPHDLMTTKVQTKASKGRGEIYRYTVRAFTMRSRVVWVERTATLRKRVIFRSSRLAFAQQRSRRAFVNVSSSVFKRETEKWRSAPMRFALLALISRPVKGQAAQSSFTYLIRCFISAMLRPLEKYKKKKERKRHNVYYVLRCLAIADIIGFSLLFVFFLGFFLFFYKQIFFAGVSQTAI